MALLLCTVAIFSAKAQDTTRMGGMKQWFAKPEGSGLIQVSYRHAKLGQLNSVLNKNGIPNLPSNDIWLNLVADHIHGDWIFEDGIGFTPVSTSTGDNNIKAKYNQYQLYFRLAYNVSPSSDFRLYPFAGINLSAANLRIQDKGRIDNTSDFSQELLNSTASKNLWQPNFGIDLGAGFDYLIKVKSKQIDCVTIQRSIPIGVRVGYYINAANGDWRVDDHRLTDGPAEKQSNVFVSLNIGLGYKISK